MVTLFHCGEQNFKLFKKNPTYLNNNVIAQTLKWDR